YIEITADDLYHSDKSVNEYKQFDQDSIYYEPDADSEGFILGIKDANLGTEEKATSDYFLNWGAEGTNAKERILTLGGDEITITASNGKLVQYLGDPNANHIGHGIGVKNDGGIQKDETITIDFKTRPADTVTLGLDGLGGWFEQGVGEPNETFVVISVNYTDENGITGTAQYTYQKHSSGDVDLFHEITISANAEDLSNGTLVAVGAPLPEGALISSVELGTQGNGNWELRYLETELSDSFDYHAVDSDGNVSDQSTVTIDEGNAPPKANNDPVGEFIVSLGEYNQGSWHHGGLTDDQGLNADYNGDDKGWNTNGDKLGVNGDVNGGPGNQIQYNREAGKSEQVTINFKEPITEFKFSVSNLYQNEGGTGNHEQGKWVAYFDGVAVASGMFTANDDNSNNKGEYTFDSDALGGVAFDSIVFEATDFVIQPDPNKGDDSSDYFLTGFEGTGGGAYVVNQGSELKIPLSELLSNDTDIDGDAIRITAITKSGEQADVYVQGDYVYFTSSKPGATTFTYQITDDKGGFDEAEVSVIVNPGPASASIDSITMHESEVAEGDNLVYLVKLDQGVLATGEDAQYKITFGKADDAATDSDVNLSNAQFTHGVKFENGQLIVPQGVSSFSIIISTVGDSKFEHLEDYTVSITSPDGSIVSASGNIINVVADAHGFEDQPIDLGLTNVDLSLISSLTLSNVPDGGNILVNGEPVDLNDSSATIDIDDDTAIELLPPKDSHGDFTLNVQPNNSEGEPLGSAQKVDIKVEAVADKPIVQLADEKIIASQNFESIELNGSKWTGKVTGDDLTDADSGVWGTNNNPGTVEVGLEGTYRPGKSDNQIMELEGNRGDSSLFVEFTGVAGAFYEISFDAAARRLGSSPLTVFLEDAGGVRTPVFVYEQSKDWSSIQQHFQIPTDGEYKLVFESDHGNASDTDTFGVLLDNIQLAKTDNYGFEGEFINLSDINISASDVIGMAGHEYGSETLTIKMEGIPAGAELRINSGNEIIPITVTDGVVDLTKYQDKLADLQIMIPDASDSSIPLTVTATSTEESNDDASTSDPVVINVTVVKNNPPESKDFDTEVSHSGKTQVVFDTAKTPITDTSDDRISDLEDDAANIDLKIVISELPDHGTLYYKDGDNYIEITADDLYHPDKSSDQYKQFDQDSIHYEPDADSEGFILGINSDAESKPLGQDNKGSSTTDFYNWGEKVSDTVRELKLNDTDVVTITSTSTKNKDATLTQYNGEANKNHVGYGIGVGGDYGINKNETLAIEFSSRPADSITLGLDGLGGYFEEGLGTNKETSVVITISYVDQNGITGSAQYTYQKHSSGDVDLFHEITIPPNPENMPNGSLIAVGDSLPEGALVDGVELSTQGKGNWELRYLETELSDSFDYHAVDSDGNVSNQSTVTIDEANAPPVATDDPVGTFTVLLGGYNQGSWQHDGLTDKNGLSAGYRGNDKTLNTSGNKLGVDGDVNGGPGNQIQYNREDGKSEQVTINFKEPITEFKFSVSNLYKNEGGTTNHEQGKWVAYFKGVAVASGMFTAIDGNNKGEYEFNSNDFGDIAFDSIVFEATDFVIQPDPNKGDDSSDYFLTGFEGKGGGAYVVNQGSELKIPLSELLRNDTDIDGDAIRITAITKSGDDAEVYIKDGLVHFKSSVPGKTTFDYQITDDKGGFAEATVSVIVNPNPDAVPVTQVSLLESEVAEGDNLVYLVALKQGVLATGDNAKYEIAFGKAGDAANDSDVNLSNAQFTHGVKLENGQLIVPQGVSSFSIIIPTVDDSKFEHLEDYTVSITSPDGSTASASGNIINVVADAHGFEDQPIDLGLTNVDLSLISSLTLSNVPDGGKILVNGEPVDLNDSSATLDIDANTTIEFLPPKDSHGDFTLNVQPNNVEGKPLGSAQKVDIKVEAVADKPIVQLADEKIIASQHFESIEL
ncbi:Ig-like domain-containing protein, partial [Vibrio ponticus]|uniref:Ig-like domain-containing protein n=1 Tax=Vibrio ponticus TaxID=265668 RepID=UPI0015C58325